MFNPVANLRNWKRRQVCLLRRPLIEKEIKQSIEDKILFLKYNNHCKKDTLMISEQWDIIISFLNVELWHIQSVIGTNIEKCKISPGMLHQSFLNHSRKQAEYYKHEDKLHLYYEKYSIIEILYLRIIRKYET